MNDSSTPMAGDRLAKVMARSGLCSRRDAEEWIKAGRVLVNGRKILTPAFNVAENDEIVVDGAPLAARQGTRVWLYHKPRGLVVTEKDPEGRPTVFETLAREGLPRVVSVGRLDINTEGLLLLTNDGGLKRVLELPATGWLRKYRVRAHGTITQAQLDGLKAGATVDGVKYGPIQATLERDQGANVWLELALREGKNREVKNVLMAMGLEVNRLIRISFGPFQLGDLPVGGVEVVKARVLKDQLGRKLAEEAAVDFDSDMPESRDTPRRRPAPAAATEERQFGRGTHTVAIGRQRFRFTDRAEKTPEEMEEVRRQRPRADRPGANSGARRAAPSRPGAGDDEPVRHIHYDDGREPIVFEEKTYGKRPSPGDRKGPRAPGGKPGGARFAGKPAAGGAPRPTRSFDDKPRRPRPEGDATRPARTFKTRPEGAADARPPRAFGDKSRGARPFAGKPARSRPEGDAARPARAYKPRAEGDAARPARAYKPRAEGDAAKPARTFKPRAEAVAGADGRPARTYKPRPSGDKSFGDKPQGARPYAGKPARPRAEGDAARPARAYKPRADTAAGAETRLARKPGAKPSPGGKPFRPRPGGPGGTRPTGGKPAGKGGSRPPSRPHEK